MSTDFPTREVLANESGKVQGVIPDHPSAPQAGRISEVSVERVVDCPFSFALQSAPLIFPILESPAAGVRIPFQELGLPFPGALMHHVVTRFHREEDVTESGRSHDEVDFDWNARSRWLPDFCGVLRFRIESLKTRVIMDGKYVPPLGRLGSIFDSLVGHRLARATATDLLDRLGGELEARWAAESRA
jgi:hypothetical protein